MSEVRVAHRLAPQSQVRSHDASQLTRKLQVRVRRFRTSHAAGRDGHHRGADCRCAIARACGRLCGPDWIAQFQIIKGKLVEVIQLLPQDCIQARHVETTFTRSSNSDIEPPSGTSRRGSQPSSSRKPATQWSTAAYGRP